MSNLSRKHVYAVFASSFLIFSFLVVPIFLTPFQGEEIQSFYQTMNDPGYEAMQWALQNTPAGSVFVSDAYYGWWFSGFAQRPTLSAVDPQYLTLAREFEPAKVAKSLLDTSYIIDNGEIQVREDGGYIGRHNPVILAKLNWTYFPYSFMSFNNSKTRIQYREGDNLQFLYIDDLPVIEMQKENHTEQANILIRKGNNFFNYTQLITVFKGVPYVDMSITVESAVEGISLDWLQFLIESKGRVLEFQNRTVGLLDEGVKALAQLIFTKELPEVQEIKNENPCTLELLYNLQGSSKSEIQISVTAYSVTDNQEIYKDDETIREEFSDDFNDNLNSYLNNSYRKPKSDMPIELFDYQKALNDWNILYIACRDSEVLPKFVNDPAFSLVFINDEVAIFTVKKEVA